MRVYQFYEFSSFISLLIPSFFGQQFALSLHFISFARAWWTRTAKCRRFDGIYVCVYAVCVLSGLCTEQSESDSRSAASSFELCAWKIITIKINFMRRQSPVEQPFAHHIWTRNENRCRERETKKCISFLFHRGSRCVAPIQQNRVAAAVWRTNERKKWLGIRCEQF